MHSPTYKHGNYTKLMQIKLFTALKSIEIGDIGDGDILNAMCDFYSNLYETKNINDADIDEYLISTETPSLSEELKQFCDQSPTKLEIRNAVFDMKSGKSPGFDGLNSEFYQCFWTDIEDLFNNIVDYIYERKEMSFTQASNYYFNF